MYQKFVGKVAIKTEMERFIFKQLSQWIYKNNLDRNSQTAMQLKCKMGGNSAMHFCFPLKREGMVYNSMNDASPARSFNVSVYISSDTIQFRIYLNGDDDYPFNDPIIFINFNYHGMFDELNLFTKKGAQLVIDNKQTMNNCIKENVLNQLIELLNYLVTNKKMPDQLKKFEEEYTGANEFIQEYMEKYFDEPEYVDFGY